jgi:hypothetical protein
MPFLDWRVQFFSMLVTVKSSLTTDPTQQTNIAPSGLFGLFVGDNRFGYATDLIDLE